MDAVTNKGAIIVAIIGAIGAIVSACITVSVQRENVVLVNDNTAMQDTISALESRISQLEQAKANSADNTEEIAQLKAENEALNANVEALQEALNNQQSTSSDFGNDKTDTASQRDLSQSVGVHTLLGGGSFGDDFRDYGTIADNHGNLHEHSINAEDRNFVPSFSINLDYQYKELSGVLFQNEYYSALSENTSLKIKTGRYYDDDSTLLWAGKVNGSSDAITFQVDVTGLRFITFSIDNASAKEPPAFFEAYLWK